MQGFQGSCFPGFYLDGKDGIALLDEEINFCFGLGFLPVPIIEFGVHIARLAVEQVLTDELLCQGSLA